MKLSDFKDEEAIEVLADLLDPVCAICADKEFAGMFKSDMPKLAIIKYALKNHSKEVIACMAILDGVDPSEYHCNMLTLPVKLLEIMDDKEFAQLFTSAGQMGGAKSSGSASENAG